MHAFLLLVHADPEMCGLLTTRLVRSGRVYLHVDRRVEPGPFRRACPEAVIVADPVRVRWGGWAQTEATVRLIEAALSDPAVSRVSLLSGQHYPIVPAADLAGDSAFGGGPVERIAALRAPDPARGKPENRFTERFFPIGRPGSRAAVVANGVARRLPALKPARALRGRSLYAGSPYFSLTRNTAEQVVRAARGDTALTGYFRRIASSDEAFFHTVVGNLDGVTIDPRGTTYVRWAGGRHPEPLAAEDLRKAVDEGFLFARKFSSADPGLVRAAEGIAAGPAAPTPG
jgi:hypothetical protein